MQSDGVEFGVTHGGRAMICDEMGLGKTVQGIMVSVLVSARLRWLACCPDGSRLQIMRHYEKEWPLLIICPSSVRYNWAEELSRWLPDLEPRHLNVIQNGNNDRIMNPEVKVHIITFQLMANAKLAAAIAAQYPLARALCARAMPGTLQR